MEWNGNGTEWNGNGTLFKIPKMSQKKIGRSEITEML